MSNSEEEKKMIVLKSNDGETFEVSAAAAAMSVTIEQMIEDDVGNEIIPLPNISGKVLARIVEYCNKHSVNSADVDKEKVNDGANDDTKAKSKDWDEQFLDIGIENLIALIQAANYLNIKSLLDLCAQTIANHIQYMTPEQVRQVFNITNDFTPEEEEAIRKDNAWAHE